MVKKQQNGPVRGWAASSCCWLLLLILVVETRAFLHPLRLQRTLQVKPAATADPKVPLLHQNGHNYRVFFRPESDAWDHDPSKSKTTRASKKMSQAWNRFTRQKRKEKEIPIKRRSRGTATTTNANVVEKPFQLKTEARVETHTKTNGVLESDNNDNNEEEQASNKGPVCRIVTLSDGKIPTSESNLPAHLYEEPQVLRKLDSIFHAMSHEEIRRLEYMQTKNYATTSKPEATESPALQQEQESHESEERNLISVVRNSLEDAGFQRLTRRDLDLCDALNAGYLLRLSIVPDVSELDAGITQEVYPEFYDDKGQIKSTEELLFEGKVLVYWRGYSQEISRGRLLLPKLDYLQASLVQRAAAWLKRSLGSVESRISRQLDDTARKVTAARIHASRAVADCVPNQPIYRALRSSLRATTQLASSKLMDEETVASNRLNGDSFFKFSRYGGSKIRFVGSPNPTDSLEPFVICDDQDECGVSNLVNGNSKKIINGNHVERKNGVQDDTLGTGTVDDDMYECLNHSGLRCSYDTRMEAEGKQLPPMQLLERVTMSNLVDPFSSVGRQNFIKSLFAKSDLVEPTYEEVVVIWRQKEDEDERLARPVWTPPRIVYELADMFDYEGLPDPESSKPKRKTPLQIRTFDQVPMANLPAVMPKTKLVFRPADAFVFDFISVLTLTATFGSLKFTSPKLDVIALLTISLWTIRLMIRYSNKLARYDLLVKKFLTSKISHRNAGALKYLLAEAGGQRAARAALVHSWLTEQDNSKALDRNAVLQQGMMEVNDLVKGKQVQVDISAALNDLEDIELISFKDGDKLEVARDKVSISKRIRRAWNAVLDGEITMAKLVGRRDHD